MVVVFVIGAIILLVMFDQPLAATLCLCVACWISGWYFAHSTVATECERLGKFFVGKTVYQCIKIEKGKDDEKISR